MFKSFTMKSGDMSHRALKHQQMASYDDPIPISKIQGSSQTTIAHHDQTPNTRHIIILCIRY